MKKKNYSQVSNIASVSVYLVDIGEGVKHPWKDLESFVM